MYIPKYKTDTDMFDKIPFIKIGQIMLRSIYPDKIEIEAKFYHIISCDPLIKRYLPGAYTENVEQAINKVEEYINRTLSGASVLFCIARTDDKKPIGYILCNSPITNYQDRQDRIGDWTIDFWLHTSVRGHGIMTQSIIHLLDHMQKMQIPKVYAYVQKENLKSINVLTKCGMKIVDETEDNKMFKMGILLND